MYQTQLNRLLLAVVVFNLCFIVGCHRSYYRRQADAEAKRLIRQKSLDPRWNGASGDIEIDPQSRMFNPFSQDHPPIPPDDAASHQLMHCVDGKEGYPQWHANGDTDAVENPTWKSYLPVNEQGQVVLTLDRAYQLALLHSPDLQQQRETLYQSALTVSLERFGFDTQLFSGFNSFYTSQGPLRTGESASILSYQAGANGGGTSIRRLGVTGANFVAGLANTILFNFSGDNTQSATSLIDFSLVQPLLRGAGRERIMEGLTQSERTLLANIRQLERFKRGFYLNIAIGRNPGAGPNFSGSFLGSPGFGNANAGGFFGLLQQQQEIRNQEFNVRQQENVLEQFREFFQRDRVNAINLQQFESSVLGAQRTLLLLRTNYQTQLDNFKAQLGLPPDIEIVIDDPFLDRFELISDDINDQFNEISDLRKLMGERLNDAGEQLERVGEAGFQVPDDLDERIQTLLPFLDEADRILAEITGKDAELVREDLRKLEASRDARMQYLEQLERDVKSGKIISNIDDNLLDPTSVPDPADLEKLLVNPEVDDLEFIIVDGERREPPRSIFKRADELGQELENVRQKVVNFSTLTEGMTPEQIFEFLGSEFQQQIPGQLAELNNLALEMSLLQAEARSNSIEISDISIDDEQATRIARCLRRDWMNARASLVDEWRNIEFVADQLEATVDLVFEGDIRNVDDNPFSLRAGTGELRAGFRFDAPITRLSERNQYRQALIGYQQTRRNFYQFEDSIKQNLRNLVRIARQNKILFELDRRAVQVDIRNVEVNRLELELPVRAGAGSQLDSNAAQRLTGAYRQLTSSQNSFLRTWVQLEVLRRNLDFDLGTMQLDELGQWIDPGQIDPTIGLRAASMMGIELDCQFCDSIGVSYEPTSPPIEEDAPGESVLFDGEDRPEIDLQKIQELRANPDLNNPVEKTPEQLQIEAEQQRIDRDRQRQEELRQLNRQLQGDPRPIRPQLENTRPRRPGDQQPPGIDRQGVPPTVEPDRFGAAPAWKVPATAVAVQANKVTRSSAAQILELMNESPAPEEVPDSPAPGNPIRLTVFVEEPQVVQQPPPGLNR